jgi:phage terminase large subunit-like protein
VTVKYPHCRAAEQYALDVVSGGIAACKWARLACQRQLDDLERVKDPDWPYRFDLAKAEKICRFIENLPHIKGKWAGSEIRLEPWQKFILTTTFGWVRKSDDLRRFREMYVEVPRKNGKSALVAGVGLFMFVEDGEAGAEVYSGATTEKQAWEVFRPARLMAKKAEGFQEHYGVRINASNICILDSAAKLEPMIGTPGDGASPHCAIVDEFHEHKSPEQYDTMITGMGARTQPLMAIITTAGYNLAGPCFDKRGQVLKILESVFDNEEIFGIVFTLDTEDDWTDFENWRKANPNFGVSVFEDYLRARHKEAMQRASRQNVIRCKHLNQWMNANTAWMDMVAWGKCEDRDLTIERFKGSPCWLALDLASKIDLAELVQLFRFQGEQGEDHYAAFCRHYLPEEATEPEDKAHYAGWAKDGWLTTTGGNVIDYGYIEEHMQAIKSEFEVIEVAYDPFQATQLATRMMAEDFPMVEVGATVRNFSEPMKELEKLVIAGRFHHNGDPVLTWMMSNVVARLDKKDNIYPNKERPENKIDGPVAIIMALSRALSADSDEGAQGMVEL